MSNHVEVKNIEPTTFENRYYDEYEYYNLTDRYTGTFSECYCLFYWYCVKVGLFFSTDLSSLFTTECTSRKGKTKKEASCNTNRPNPAGHERKIVEKLQNAEKKSKEWRKRGAQNIFSLRINIHITKNNYLIFTFVL